jgi:hypothetical protein
MNLRYFHALLILLSAILAVTFGLWSLGVFGRGTASLPVAGLAFAVAIGLVVYDSLFLRKTRTL